MSRAVFNVEAEEFERAKQKLSEKKKREVTVTEIMKEQKA